MLAHIGLMRFGVGPDETGETKMEKTYKVPGTDAEIKADFAQAASQIMVRWDSDLDWQPTPFQVADARHSPAEAVRLVKNWNG